MNFKKVQTTVKPNGWTGTRQLGWVMPVHVERDVEEERERFTRVAMAAERVGRPDRAIQTVEVAGQTVVAVYESGEVRIINYIQQEQQL